MNLERRGRKLYCSNLTLCEGSEKNHMKPRSDRDLNPRPPENEVKVLNNRTQSFFFLISILNTQQQDCSIGIPPDTCSVYSTTAI